ncbi:hypothetical protein BTO06_14680 [Tenacibaculum sp. SZ-18]|uniref:hypothetical protein n=1 Tax=Tenacibaculum sp. SZ-18 TaxID=754423 RepID=UPI000C2D2C23|nr:hypothetical protein [Tenacibaculum sp. SZ-18]AUC16317.1 hypothetical protein BTO06_14680 [Tenacibaculum sp. SZ-18]
MKSNNINTLLQIVAIIILLIIGYLVFKSSSNWKIIEIELDNVRNELKVSKNNMLNAKTELENFKIEFEQMKAKKDFIIHKRDSLIFHFKRKNAKDWQELESIKDSIRVINDKLVQDRLILDGLFGIN